MSEYHKVIRVLAWLIRNEGVEPKAIERAVGSADEMKLGQSASLEGPDDNEEVLRRAFLAEQVGRLLR